MKDKSDKLFLNREYYPSAITPGTLFFAIIICFRLGDTIVV